MNSHRRFRDTLADLEECNENLYSNLEDLGNEELEAREQLIKLCVRIGRNSKASLLSETQIKMLVFASQGLSNKKIAEKLGLKVRTVQNYMSITYQVLDVNNRTEAVVRALRRGIIEGK